MIPRPVRMSKAPAVDFEFHPGRYVRVTYLGLNYRGRVIDCIWGDGSHRYRVEYADDKGDLQAREFYADELEAAS